MLPSKPVAASWPRRRARVSTLLDRQAGAPGQASMRSSGSFVIDDQAESARRRRSHAQRLACDIERTPRRQTDFRGAGRRASIDQLRSCAASSRPKVRATPARRRCTPSTPPSRRARAGRASAQSDPAWTSSMLPRDRACGRVVAELRESAAAAMRGLGSIAATRAQPLRSRGVSSRTRNRLADSAQRRHRRARRRSTARRRHRPGKPNLPAARATSSAARRGRAPSDRTHAHLGDQPASGATMTLRGPVSDRSSRPSRSSASRSRAGVPRSGRGSAGWRAASGRYGRCPASQRCRPVPRACSSVKAPHHGRTRTIRPSPLGIGRRTPGHQPLMSRRAARLMREPSPSRGRARDRPHCAASPTGRASSASRSRAAIAAVAAGFFSSIAASTASSAISAACVASNRWSGHGVGGRGEGIERIDRSGRSRRRRDGRAPACRRASADW